MATLAKMIQNISERLLDPSNIAVSRTSVVDSINDAIDYWKTTRFWFNEVTDSAFLTTGVGDFPYPDDFLVPVVKDGGFVIAYSNQRYPLGKVSLQQYDAQFLNNGYGIPRVYARMGDNQKYQCYPLPDRDYEVLRHYLKNYVPLSNDTDTNDFTDHAAKLIESWALADLNAELRQDEVMEKYFRSRAIAQKDKILELTTKMNASGKLTIESDLM